MIDPIQQFLDGRELRDPSRPAPAPVDFAVWNATKTLVVLADWWTVSWGPGTGLIAFSAPLDPETGRFDGLQERLSISSPSDGEVLRVLQEHRRRTDLQRARYMSELLRLAEYEPEFDFSAWIDAMQERPVVDVAKEYAAKHLKLRTVGLVRVTDSSGTVVDALAVDELGSAHVADEDGWLGLFADQWAGYSDVDRPEVGPFVQWLSNQKPYGPFAVDGFEVLSADGPLDVHVTRALTRASAT